MSTTTVTQRPSSSVDAAQLSRIVQEGYGDGAWHGPDLKAALSDVTQDLALWRPGSGRHNIAEIALHHAYCVRSVRARLTGAGPEPFVLEGEDWFEVSDAGTLSWDEIQALVGSEQQRLAGAIGGTRTPGAEPPSEEERLQLVLGITCHAVYHAGQVQLIKRLHAT